MISLQMVSKKYPETVQKNIEKIKESVLIMNHSTHRTNRITQNLFKYFQCLFEAIFLHHITDCIQSIKSGRRTRTPVFAVSIFANFAYSWFDNLR